MTTIISKEFIQSLLLIACGVLIGVSVNYAFSQSSWVGPSAPPPDNGNVYPPINTGMGLQTKQGNLMLNTENLSVGLTVNGQVMLVPQSSGNITGQTGRMIRFNSSNNTYEGYVPGTGWVPFN